MSVAKDKKVVTLHLDQGLYAELDEQRWRTRTKSLSKYIELQLRKIAEGQLKQVQPEEINREEQS